LLEGHDLGPFYEHHVGPTCQAKRYAGPGDIDPPLLVGSVLNLLYREAAVSGEVLDLF
jgi:hypothetical protein